MQKFIAKFIIWLIAFAYIEYQNSKDLFPYNIIGSLILYLCHLWKRSISRNIVTFPFLSNLLKKKNPANLWTPLTRFPLRLGLRHRDRVQRWTDPGSVALILSLSSSLFVFLLSLLMATKSDNTEPPSSPLSSPTLRLSSLSSDLVLYGGVLLKALGGASPQRTLSLLSECRGLSNGHRDLLRLWMCGGHRVWGVIPGRVSFDSPTFGVDYSKLFIWKSPYHTRIKWKLRFDLTVVCLARSKVPNLLLFRTLVAVVALEFSGILVTLYAVFCYCCSWCCCCCLFFFSCTVFLPSA